MSLQKGHPTLSLVTVALALLFATLPATACPPVETVPTDKNTSLMPEATSEVPPEEPKRAGNTAPQEPGQAKPSQQENTSQQKSKPFNRKKMKPVVA
jgi:hypothetical protein